MDSESSTLPSPGAPACYECQAPPVALVMPPQIETPSAGDRLPPMPPVWKCGRHVVEDLKLRRRVQPLLLPLGNKPGRPAGSGSSWRAAVRGARMSPALALRAIRATEGSTL